MNLKFSPYSYSKINTYKNCPYRFKLQYIDKIKTPFVLNKSLEKGSFLHKGIELYLKDEIKKITDFEFKVYQGEERSELFKQLKQILKSDNIQNYKSKSNLFIEMGFGLDIDTLEVKDYNYKSDIIGFIDLMYYDKDEKIVYIIDHKTGRFNENQDKIQLYIYYLVALSLFPAEKAKLYFEFIEHNKNITFEFDKSEKQKIQDEVKKVISAIETAKSFPKKDTFCNWCPYFEHNLCDGNADTPTMELDIF